MLVVISGLPGVGKTTIADLVGRRLGAVRLSIDPVEDALLAAGCAPGWRTGVAAYEAVGAMVELNLGAGLAVVLDAVNDSEPARDTWRRAAASTGVDLCWIVLTMADSAAHESRLHERDRGFRHVPEPTWSDVDGRRIEPWEDAHLSIDVSGRTPAQIAADVERYAAGGRVSE